MNDEISGHPQSSWTWADMFVTYRFWGLLLFYLFSLAASGMVLSWFPLLLRDVSPSSATTLSGWLFYVAGLSGLVGFYLAWAATRHRAKVVLLVAGLLQLVGGLLL
ncbi:MAG: hypothetical protein JXM73_08710, partial [Anaerolineae bacterium]|nr:hypothetical protein [Anaerolineae bacterium]